MRNLTLFIVSMLMICTLCIQAQNRYGDSYNRLGIQAGINYGGFNSDDFNTSEKAGYMVGLTTRAAVYNNFIIIYGINFYEFKTGINIMETQASQSIVANFKATGVQLNLFGGHKIIGEHLSFEAGPVLQINSKWKPEKEFENYFIEGYDLQAEDLEEISRVNFNVAGNISAGFRDVKLWIQYQYGVNNIFSKLNSEGLENKDSRAANLNGHLGLATAGIVVYL
ncbi:hypothetical protein ACKGJN_02875 [Gillisia sp. Q332]|uniref:hypothetical protein n=1 Tax=Gillisia xinjiangensis TaxID=3384765 RepID=UPI00391A1A7E